jgi:PKD repeat protein
MNRLKYKNNILLSLFSMFFLIPCASFSQDRFPCGTTEMVKKALQNNPTAVKNLADLEYYTQTYGKNFKTDNSGILIIPVVFHIIHNYGGENIPKSQVLQAMKIINEDFRKKNADTIDVVPAFKNLIADAQIEFRLAQIDPFGNCTDGITRTVSDLTFAGDESVKDLISWNTNTQNYLQVWVVQTIASGAGGYSAYPGVFAPDKEGIVIRNSQITDRSLTHEIGHYLNLMHTWGNTNDPGLPINCGDDDQVNDTPNTIGHTKCDLYTPSCGSTIDNVQNYMEYSFCSKMFTKGQSARMNTALNFTVGDRDNLWSASNLVATGTNTGYVTKQCKPVADFSIESNLICEGGSITFNDLSWNADTLHHSWSFPGGTPSSSGLKNPVIQYNTAGIYGVTLTVSNNGGSKSLTKTNAIHVVSKSTAIPMNTFSEGFESMSFPNTNWLLNNPDGANTWSIVTNAGYSSARCIRMNNFGNPEGSVDAFITPQFDFSNTTRPVISFRISSARKTSTDNDQLKVLVSTDCGEKWVTKYSKKGVSLANAGIVTTSFKPSNNSQWRVDSIINLSGYAGNPSVRFKFEFTGDGGNNLYIDNINLDNSTSISNPEVEGFNFELFPNPAQDETSLHFSLRSAKMVSVQVLDMLGRIVKSIDAKNYSSGEHSILLKRNDIPSGNYVVKLLIDDRPFVRRMILQ